MRCWLFALRRFVMMKWVALLVSLTGAQTLEERLERAYQDAIQAIPEIKREFERSRALREITEALAMTGKFDRALDIAPKIEDPSWRSLAFRDYCHSDGESGSI